ncbi:MAG: PCRF domain-containing protein, partial [Betaproteobacteria bacterium]
MKDVSAALEDPGVWNDPKRAQELGREKKLLDDVVGRMTRLTAGIHDAAELYEMAAGDNDDATLVAIEADMAKLAKEVGELEFQRMFNSPLDPNNCFIEIQAGAGGTEAQDWAGMLERMYLYYWNEMGWKAEEMHRSPGAEAGVSEVGYRLEGPFAFGYMGCERGTHRLARVSPFNAEGKRQTSFCTVDVTPEFEESDLEIPERDLEIVPFVRASGPGGQNVNKVATAIRVTH